MSDHLSPGGFRLTHVHRDGKNRGAESMLKRYGFYFSPETGGAGGAGEGTQNANAAASTGNTPANQNTATPPVQTAEKTFTQADVDRIVKERLEREKAKAEEAAAEMKRKAVAEAAAKNGEWQKLAEQRDEDLKKMQADLRDRDIRLKALGLGLTDLDYAVFLVTKAGENADPETVLKEYLQKNPNAAKPQITLPNNPTNPSNIGQTFTRTQLKDPVFFAANRAAILQAAKEGRIREE